MTGPGELPLNALTCRLYDPCRTQRKMTALTMAPTTTTNPTTTPAIHHLGGEGEGNGLIYGGETIEHEGGEADALR
jgi:hypothetical protein